MPLTLIIFVRIYHDWLNSVARKSLIRNLSKDLEDAFQLFMENQAPLREYKNLVAVV